LSTTLVTLSKLEHFLYR